MTIKQSDPQTTAEDRAKALYGSSPIRGVILPWDIASQEIRDFWIEVIKHGDRIKCPHCAAGMLIRDDQSCDLCGDGELSAELCK